MRSRTGALATNLHFFTAGGYGNMFHLYLEVLAGEKIHRRIFELEEGGKAYIGAEGCDLNLPHRAVGRRHFGFGVKNGKLFAGDLGCPGGTLYNGHPFKQGYVKPNDVFQVGPYRVRIASFEAHKDAPKSQAQVAVELPFLRENQAPQVSYREFFKAFFVDPMRAWDRVANRAPVQALGIALAKGVAVTTIVTVILGFLHVGFMVNPINAAMAMIYGIVWMVAGWAVGAAILYYVLFPIMKAKYDWHSLLSYLIACAALALPVQVLSLVGLGMLGNLMHAAFCMYGSWRMFAPDRQRFMIVASACAMLMVVAMGTTWRAERAVGDLDRQLASFEKTVDQLQKASISR